jgi:hypothetical protein
MGSDVLGGPASGSIVSVTKCLDGLPQIAQQVPSIGDLDGARSTMTDTVGIGARTIAGDDLDTWAITKPGGDGGGLTIRQEIDHVVRLEVYQHRAVTTTPPPCPVVDAKNTRRWRDLRRSAGRSKAQQCVRARRSRDPCGQARSSFPAERKTKVVLEISQSHGPAASKPRHVRQAL